ncbi:hypothetical protein [Serratia sp. UGAL515B_01]|uniref:hypothetical protein n=1 Tax=Serratia sp. UGAL515B_01 TaxID=2986763 RepID=UPI002953C5AA|nr:hypothetical protein [Serratia sp. UGAL515B_01]WON77064.1 hypothetical protein OK023_18165 [Serratia sp. UGAL515B_01]
MYTPYSIFRYTRENNSARPTNSGRTRESENGEVIIGGDWLTESGIASAEQLEVTAAPGVLRLQRR